jgi:hypothetical protein
MLEEFSNNNSSMGSVLVGIILGLVGFAMMIFSILIGSIVVVLAVVLFFLMRYLATDTTVSCHEDGFTVKVISKRKGTSVQEYAWADVTETHYYERESGGENSSTSSYFQVKTVKGMAFNLHEMKNFDDLIKIVNQNTQHLPYEWEKQKGLFKSYQKQNRISY